jgi:signal transduction histidine kinase
LKVTISILCVISLLVFPALRTNALSLEKVFLESNSETIVTELSDTTDQQSGSILNSLEIPAHLPSHVRIETISSFGDTLYHQTDPTIKQSKIRVPSYQNSLTFTLAVIPYNRNQNYEYTFRLIGDEDDFTPWSVSNTRTYYNLNSGVYNLVGKVRNIEGIESVTTLLEIRIQAPWFRRWPALLMYFAFTLLLFTLVFRMRSERSVKKKKQLENEIRIRTNLLMEQARELKTQKEKYQQANEIKTRLLRFAAHDLRNPITAIMGYSRMLETEEDDEKQREYATVIHDISQKMYTIVQNMLASGARDEDSLALDFEHVDIYQILEKLKKQYHFFLKEKKQTLIFDVDEGITNILADKVRISEVLENLLSNAIKFSPKNAAITIKASESLDPRAGKRMVSISVSDMGPGFSDKDQALAFREFQTLSAKPTAANESSTGLGLFIVKQLVAAHDGRIFIKNNENGIGCTIGVMIPSTEYGTAKETKESIVSNN